MRLKSIRDSREVLSAWEDSGRGEVRVAEGKK
jgi:hypothetical protein